MYRICFIDEDFTTFDLPCDFSCFSEMFLLDLSLLTGKNLTVIDPSGYIVASCFDGVIVRY